MAEQALAASPGLLPILEKLKGLSKHTDVLFAIGIVSIIVVLILPIPTMLLDVLLGFSITLSVLILMTVMFISKPLEFSSFPSILLIAAMVRLSLNIASTRLILANGHTGPDAAGEVIKAFGGFVMAGSVVIGAIVFGILTIINFVVITKGSGRIAEVSARFSLDAMPGKQMAIDADLSSGLIDEKAAKVRRKELEDESTFYGAMDGANKFVRGDAVAGLLITFINFIGGMIIGIVQRDLSFSQALETYTALTIGDGLVSQIPSLVVSTAAGLLVTKSGVQGSADKAVFGQLGRFPQALFVVAGLIFSMALMPGIPFFIFAMIAFIMAGAGWLIYKKMPVAKEAAKAVEVKAKQEEAAKKAQKAGAEEDPVANALKIDSIRIELGYGLLPLINYEKGTKLPDQVKALRKQIAQELGFVLPSVRIQDNLQLSANEYVVRVKEIECGRGEVRPEMLMVMDPRGQKIALPGEDTKEPAFGLPARWVSESMREEALFKNYTVVDPPTVITTHVTEIIKENITELLSYGETKKLLDTISEENKKLAEDAVPQKISIGGLQRILQNLLAEGVSIRDLPTILEAVVEASASTRSVTLITEHVRSRLSRQLCNANTGAEGHIEVVALSPMWEQTFSEHLRGSDEEKQLALPPSKLQEFIKMFKRSYEQHSLRGANPVLLVSPTIRPYVRSIIERVRAQTMVMSQNEIHPRAKIKTIGQL